VFAWAGPATAGPKHRAPPRFAQAPPPGRSQDPPKFVEISISPREAAAIAASATGGRVLDVRFQGGNRPRYRVRILLRGERVRTVTVDAVTGEFRG
jgi:uncharacterized membrane protein YkoI